MTVAYRLITDADAIAVRRLTNAHLTARGNPDRITAADVRRRLAQGDRISVAHEGQRLLAILSAIPHNTEDGNGWRVNALIVRPGPTDATTILDGLILFTARIAIAEGAFAIHGGEGYNTAVRAYARDQLGVQETPYGRDVITGATTHTMTADARDITAAILRRHPEWAQ